MKIRNILGSVAIAATLMFGTSSCGCGDMEASEQDREAAANGYEVERNGCELSEDGEWEYDD